MKNIPVEDVEVIDLSNNKKDYDKFSGKKSKKSKKCSSCKNPGLKFGNWVGIILGFYILFASIYGTIQLIKSIF